MSSDDMKGDLVLEDIVTGETFVLESGRYTFECGRRKHCDIITESTLASRSHCSFVRLSNGLHVMDMENANGTFVNGVKLEKSAKLKINDLIGLGCCDLTPVLAANGVQYAIKTIFRLKHPELPASTQGNLPAPHKTELVESSPNEACSTEAGSTNKIQRKRSCSTGIGGPIKIAKKEGGPAIPLIIDISDDSDDAMPAAPEGWSTARRSINPFESANISVIKYEPAPRPSVASEASTSRVSEPSVPLVTDHDAISTGKATCYVYTKEEKPQDGAPILKHEAREYMQRATDMTNGRENSSDTNTRGEELVEERAETSPNLATSSFASSRPHEQELPSRAANPGDDRRADSTSSSVKHSNPATTSSIEPPISNTSSNPSRHVNLKKERPDDEPELAPNPSSSRKGHPEVANSSIDPPRRTECPQPTRRCSSEDDSSGEDIDVLRREGLLDQHHDASSHSSWESVEDFSIPGYNAPEDDSETKNNAGSANYIAVDQLIKYEPELDIVDDDEDMFMDEGHSAPSDTCIKLKRAPKSEPILEYSTNDVVTISDDEDGFFPPSQLFGDEEIKAEPKCKMENEDDEYENERLDNREIHSPDMIYLSDSDEEDALYRQSDSWYEKLMVGELNMSRESPIEKEEEEEEEEEMEYAEDFPAPDFDDAVPEILPEEPARYPLVHEVAAPVPSFDETSPVPSIEETSPKFSPEAVESPVHEDAAASPEINIAEQSYDICFSGGEREPKKSICGADTHEVKKRLSERPEKREKHSNDLATKRVSHDHRSPEYEYDSTSVRLKGDDSKTHQKIISAHQAIQKPAKRTADSEDTESKAQKTSHKFKSRHDSKKRTHHDTVEAAGIPDDCKKRDSTEEKSNLRTEGSVTNRSNDKRDSPEDGACRSKGTHFSSTADRRKQKRHCRSLATGSNHQTKGSSAVDTYEDKRESSKERSHRQGKDSGVSDKRFDQRDPSERKSNFRARTSSAASSREVDQDSSEERSNLQIKASGIANRRDHKRISTEERPHHETRGDSPEEKSTHRTKASRVTDKHEKKRSSSEEQSHLRTKASSIDSRRDQKRNSSEGRPQHHGTKGDSSGDKSTHRPKASRVTDKYDDRRGSTEEHSNLRTKASSNADKRDQKRISSEERPPRHGTKADTSEVKSTHQPKASRVTGKYDRKLDSAEEPSTHRTKAASITNGRDQKRNSSEERSTHRPKASRVTDKYDGKLDSSEEPSKLRTNASSIANGREKNRISSEKKPPNRKTEGDSSEERSTLHTQADGTGDSHGDKRDSASDSISHRLPELPIESLTNPVVVLTKLDYPCEKPQRRAVQVVPAPHIGHGQRRGAATSVKIIDRSTDKADFHASSSSGVQANVAVSSKSSSPPNNRKLSTKEKKEMAYQAKADAKKYKKEQQFRRMRNQWIDKSLPQRNTVPPSLLSRDERDEIKKDRKERLKQIADEKNKLAEANASPVQRTKAKAKAKVTIKTRNDFLVDEIRDCTGKGANNVDRPPAQEKDKTPAESRGKEQFVESRKETITNGELPAEHKSDAVAEQLARKSANIERPAVEHTEKIDEKEKRHDKFPQPKKKPASLDQILATHDSQRHTQFDGKKNVSPDIQPSTGFNANDAKQRNDKHPREETARNDEILFANGANFYREYNETEREASPPRSGKRSPVSTGVSLSSREKSPKGKRRIRDSLDSGKENAETSTGEGVAPVRNLPRIKSVLTLVPKKGESPTQLDTTTLPIGLLTATRTQNVVEKPEIVDGSTLNNNFIHYKDSTTASRDPRITAGKPVLKSCIQSETGHRTRGIEPRAIKRVAFDDLNTKVQLFEIDPGNTLRKCDFKDAPSLKNRRAHSRRHHVDTSACLKKEKYLSRIVEWNPVWLTEQLRMNKPPPVVRPGEVVQMPPRYDSYEKYYNITEPLLALELWNGMTRDFQDREMFQKCVEKLVWKINLISIPCAWQAALLMAVL